MEITVTEYPEQIKGIMFEHEGRDTQFWAGHYGSKMAGGVFKLLFDSIQPLKRDGTENIKPPPSFEVEFETNGEIENSAPVPGANHIGLWYAESDELDEDEDYNAEELEDNPNDNLMPVLWARWPY